MKIILQLFVVVKFVGESQQHTCSRYNRKGDIKPLVLCFLDVCVDEISHTVTQAGNTIPLKPMEYDLLVNFLRHPGKLLTREHLLRQVWGDEYIGETRTVDVHVARLRKMLGWSTDQIATVYKLGYRLEAEP